MVDTVHSNQLSVWHPTLSACSINVLWHLSCAKCGRMLLQVKSIFPQNSIIPDICALSAEGGWGMIW